jgi:methionine aminopeptidase
MLVTLLVCYFIVPSQHENKSLKMHLVLQKGDVLKVDIGVHVKGRIVDSAFTLAWEHTYDKLIEAVKAATNTGVRVSKICTI